MKITAPHQRSFHTRLCAQFLNIILPPRCPVTGELVGEQGVIDPAFWGRLNFIHTPLCNKCGTPFPHDAEPEMICGECLQHPPVFRQARSIWRYDDRSSGMILKFKHADGTQLAPMLSYYLHQAGMDLMDHNDIILPVPLHRWRLLKRRYNQAALLTKWLSRRTGLPHAPHVLRRVRHTPPQGHKTRDQRRQNIARAFAIAESQRPHILNKRILLVDDVFTSGATLNECINTLLQAGATTVDVLTLAKVVKS